MPDFNVEDNLIWKSNSNGVLSFKTAYNIVVKPSPSMFWSNFPWDKASPPSHSMVVWRYIHRKIPTDDCFLIRGFSIPSMCTLCCFSPETVDHLFFGSLTVLKSTIVGIFYHIWRSRNKARQENASIHWKSCYTISAAQAKLVRNTTGNKSNSSITSFSMLKRFDVNINPRNTTTSFDVLWSPPLHGWTKCNIDGVAIGSPWKSACGGIFWDIEARHVLSFIIPLGRAPLANAELLATIVAMEKAMELRLNKCWLESDCTLVVKAFYNHALVPWTI
ncbi:uncharacterized protein LOC131605827 [Vicia villosa]|uniref:uncharacterized protein LOC131605827 n=1 Tax=Vicia villosa TaxID=3911 RepID=UPI00273A9A70|nr:uncharacterized protein LOC131605827 [Vicia villosa]